jgi:hypothetical protein
VQERREVESFLQELAEEQHTHEVVPQPGSRHPPRMMLPAPPSDSVAVSSQEILGAAAATISSRNFTSTRDAGGVRL